MSSKKNIEDLFREGLEDLNIKPSGKVWSGINKQMTGPRLEATYRNAFEGFRINPSEQIWRRIAAAVWLQKFIHFTPFSFNIYYLAIITTAIVGTVITVNNNQNLNFVDFNQDKYSVVSTDSVNNLPEDLINVSKMLKISPQIANQIGDMSISNTNKDTQEDASEIKNNTVMNVVNYQQQNSINTETFESSNFKNQNNNNLSQTENRINYQQQNNFSILQENISGIENSLNINNTNEIIYNSANSLVTEPEIKSNILPQRIRNNKSLLLTYSPLWNEKADNALNTVPKYDEITKDTLGYNFAGDPIIVDKSWFEAGISYGLYSFANKYSLKNDELVSNYLMLKNGVRPEPSWSMGLSLSYNNNKFRIESGFLFSSENESFNQQIKAYDTCTVYSYNYFQNSEWDYDTTMILDLNEYLQGNIVYIPYVDSTQFYFNDSLLVSKLDSVLIDKELKSLSNSKYIGIPLIGGYEFTLNKFALSPRAGLICNILVSNNGYSYNIAENAIAENLLLPFNKLVFQYYGALNLQYRPFEHFSIFIEPYLSGSLNPIYKTGYAVDKRSTKYGVKAGISYRF